LSRHAVEIDRPICILGTGRSGTTLLYRLLGHHPDLGWFSTINARIPQFPSLAIFSRIADVASGHAYQSWKIVPRPVESYKIYNYLTHSIFTQPRPLNLSDATPEVVQRYRHYVQAILKYQGKKRFLQKHNGFPRIKYLHVIFPDARFIHVIRDGRSVANSLLHVPWWDGTIKSWWWGPMKSSYENEYVASNQEPAILGAIVWKTLLDFLEEERTELPSAPLMEVRFDELISDTDRVMQDVLKFCELPDSDVFRRRISAVPIRKERKPDFDSRVATLINSCLSEHLTRYGFCP
jgi:omega-hydroxy-beta-dihydromenaquinone-9 sulfotransferase